MASTGETLTLRGLPLTLTGIVASGGMLIFGGEISEFTRRIMYVVLVAAIILGAASLMTTLFTTAALVS